MFPVMNTGGGQCFAFPDVCKTPTPAGPVPLPYPNIAQCSDGSGSSKVKTEGSEILRKGDTIRMSSGDEAGAAMGVASSKIKGTAEIMTGMDRVKAEGKAVGYLTSSCDQNGGSMKNSTKLGVNVSPGKVKVKVLSVRGTDRDVRAKVNKYHPGNESFKPTAAMHALAKTAANAILPKNVRAASEELGDAGAMNAANKIAGRFGGLAGTGALVKGIFSWTGRSVVDVIAICAKGILVIEAKGGASPLGSAMSGGWRYQQGTAKYLMMIAKRMSKRADPIGAAGRKLMAALKNGKPPVRYAEARTTYDSTGSGKTVVKEFDP